MRIIPSALGVILSSCMLYATPVTAQTTIAGCDIHTNQLTSKYDPYLVDHYKIMNWSNWPASVSVPMDAIPGDVLHRTTAWVTPNIETMTNNQKAAAAYIPLANCPRGVTELFQPTGIQHYGDIYRHNLSTIGVRTYYPHISGTGGRSGTVENTSTGALNMLYFPFGQAVVEFVLLSQEWGNTASQTLTFPSSRIASTTVAGWGRDNMLRYEALGSIRFVPEPCKFVTDTTMTQDLDPVDASLFTTTGTQLAPKRFSLRMQCNSSRPKPKVTFSGALESATLPGVLKNEAPSNNTATGVGILLEHIPPGGSPTPAPLNNSTGVTTLVSNGSCGANTFSCEESQINLQASYYSTAATVTPGAVLSRVTVTVEHM